MLNYLKSELYRVFHSSGIYLFMGICSLLMFAMNLVLWAANLKINNFPYANIDFSFSMLTTYMNVVLIVTAFFACVITADEFKFRTINNSIAFGISRIQIFICKILVALITASLSLVVIEGVLIVSGYLLLDSSSPDALTGILTATVACIPSLIAGLIAAISLYLLLGNITSAIWSWCGIMIAFPMIVSLLSLKFNFFSWLNRWLIFHIVTDYYFSVEEDRLIYIWSTEQGIYHCLLTGFLGILVFIILGILGFRKRDM